ncbi:MAG: hypothetical protein HY912_01930 [Desulfomonile tiedjei]|uniref:Uncharacterized protein n=1 Tax=Desulfomonile tiedjei TaxID=2358 RepID=A0A9D6V044_9BACT|nr:hypothetical protein [Desulfomonile tiedjei]
MGLNLFRLAGLVWFVVLVLAGSPSADVFDDPLPDEILEGANFYIAPRPNYEGSFWVFDQSTNKVIGYAPWDSVNRRWTLFSLNAEYKGFIQATTGATNPPHFTQYLYYGRENQYKGVFVAALGGRPVSPDLPHGELGGSLALYEIGNLPVPAPTYEPEVDPLRRFPDGVDVSPVERPSMR